MSDEIKRQELYLRKLQNWLDDQIPAKHQHRAKEFRQMLTNEIKDVKAKIADLKLEAK